jgi:hypothetical protein
MQGQPVQSAVRFVTSEKVDIETLDTIAENYVLNNKTVLLKLDVQGRESDALAGGSKLIEHLQGVQLELCVEPTYEGQERYDYFFALMRSLGFELALIDPFGFDNQSGLMMEFDALFVKRHLLH